MSADQVFRLDDAELEEVRAHGGLGTILCRRLVDGDRFESPCSFVDYAVLPPGTSIGTHRHGENEEIYLILEGTGTMVLDERELAVREGHVIVNRPGGTHGLRNDSDAPLRVFVVEIALARSKTDGEEEA